MAALPCQMMGVIVVRICWEQGWREGKDKTDPLVELNFLGLLALSGQGW